MQGRACKAIFDDRVDPDPCLDAFEGKLALGATCDYAEQCPRGAGCIGSMSAGYRCQTIPKKGEPCTGYCPAGLYCDIDSSSPTCVTQKPTGASCDPARLECEGICDFDTKQCQAFTFTPACVGK